MDKQKNTKRKLKPVSGAPLLFKPDSTKDYVHLAIQRDFGEFENNTVYHSDSSHLQHDKRRQSTELLKKYKSSSKSAAEKTKTAALDKFRDILKHVRHANIDFGTIEDRLSKPHHHRMFLDSDGLSDIEIALLRARHFAWTILGNSPDLEKWFMLCKHGGGTTVGTTYAKCGLDDKLDLPMSGTSDACALFLNLYLPFDTAMSGAIKARYPKACREDICEIVEGSRTTTVEKNDEIDRVIAIEPTVNMYLQQGLMLLMYQLMSPFLDLENAQTRHQTMAAFGSVYRLLATVDFESASDCVIIAFLKWFLPPKWYYWLKMVRSPVTEVPNLGPVALPMFSTMGNATTFPIETLVFYSILVAVTGQYEHKSLLVTNYDELKDSISTFGDDCILPSANAPFFMEVCSAVGFKVNVEKTHYKVEDCFRESCGGDFFLGHNIRPFHLRAPHNNKLSSYEPWCYVIINRLIKKYNSCFGEGSYMYKPGFRWLVKKLLCFEYVTVKCVPKDYPDDSGLQILEDPWPWITSFPKLHWARIGVDKHGTIDFSYCKFKYTEHEPSNVNRYSEWLKSSSGTVRDRHPRFSSESDEMYDRRICLERLKIFERTTQRRLAKSQLDQIVPNEYGTRSDAFKSLLKPHGYLDKRIGGYVVARSRQVLVSTLTKDLPHGESRKRLLDFSKQM